MSLNSLKMVKKCLYCGVELENESVIDFCKKCGVNAFGPKMFDAIVQQMENAKSKGTLTHQDTSKGAE